MDKLTMFAELRPDDDLTDSELADLRTNLFPTVAPAEHDVDGHHKVNESRKAAFWMSAACVAALMGGLMLAVGNRNNREAATQPIAHLSSMVVAEDAGRWLDLPAEPAGLVRDDNTELAETTVCKSALVRDDLLTCTELEGQIGSNYPPAADGVDADESTYEVSIRTRFTDQPGEQFAEELQASLDGDMTPTTIRGRNGYVINGSDTNWLVWGEQPGTVSTLQIASHSGWDPFELADALIEQEWPTSIKPPLVAVEYGANWRAASGNNHPYALVTSDGQQVCISVAFAAPKPDTGSTQVCTTGAEVWTIGTIDFDEIALGSQDVFAGLVPPAVTSVRLRYEDGEVIEAATQPVTGISQRAFGIAIDRPQGALIEAELTGNDTTGEQTLRTNIVAVMPTVNVNTVCDAPGATGIVPNVIGQELNIAYEALRDAGLVVALPIVSDRTPVVTGQSPEPGTQRGCGDVLLTTDL